MKPLSSQLRCISWSALCMVGVCLGHLAVLSQECRILSFDRSGSLIWTNSHTNIYAGFQATTRLGDQWLPAPPPFWNFMLTSYSNHGQVPPDAMSLDQLYLRLVISSNDLGSGFPVYQVPQRTIVVDGNTNDWNGVAPAVSDRLGDGNQLRGSDITALFLARDANTNNIYVRLDLADGPPSSNLYFGINFQRNDTTGVRFIFVEMNQLRCSVDEWIDDYGNHTLIATGNLAVNQNVLELSVPANALNAPSPSFVNAWNDTTGRAIDETDIVEARW